MKNVTSLDPNDRTPNCPAVLIDKEEVLHKLRSISGDFLIHELTEEIENAFIKSMLEDGWSSVQFYGQSSLLVAKVSINTDRLLITATTSNLHSS